MGHMSVNQVWRSRTEIEDSEYTRMIPGSPAPARSRPVPLAVGWLDDGRQETVADRRRRLGIGMRLAQFLLPQPEASDRFALCRMVATDLIVLMGTCLLPSFALPAWGLPLPIVPVYAVLVTLFGFTEGLYKRPWEARVAPVIAISVRAVLFALGFACIAAYGCVSLVAVPVTLATSLAGLSIWRWWSRIGWRGGSSAADCCNVLIVGAGPVGRAIARALRDPEYKMVVRGFVDETQVLSKDVLGRIEDLAWLARAEFIDELILALPGQPARVREVAEIARRNHLDVRAVLDMPADPWLAAGFDRIGDLPVVTLHREPLPNAGLFLKRALDIAGALLGLVLSSPVMAIVAALIRRDTPGPAIYSARRTGAKGRSFRCYKFRSMVAGADRLKQGLQARNQREGPIFKLDCDPRVTRVGRFIRRYSLDELPQLWNVLRGDMSLVGPRPHPVDEVKHYQLQHFRRLDVKPGITGLWQVTARKNPSFELNMHLDLTYIETWNLLLDLRILLRTVRVLFMPEGS